MPSSGAGPEGALRAGRGASRPGSRVSGRRRRSHRSCGPPRARVGEPGGPPPDRVVSRCCSPKAAVGEVVRRDGPLECVASTPLPSGGAMTAALRARLREDQEVGPPLRRAARPALRWGASQWGGWLLELLGAGTTGRRWQPNRRPGGPGGAQRAARPAQRPVERGRHRSIRRTVSWGMLHHSIGKISRSCSPKLPGAARCGEAPAGGILASTGGCRRSRVRSAEAGAPQGRQEQPPAPIRRGQRARGGEAVPASRGERPWGRGVSPLTGRGPLQIRGGRITCT